MSHFKAKSPFVCLSVRYIVRLCLRRSLTHTALTHENDRLLPTQVPDSTQTQDSPLLTLQGGPKSKPLPNYK